MNTLKTQDNAALRYEPRNIDTMLGSRKGSPNLPYYCWYNTYSWHHNHSCGTHATRLPFSSCSRLCSHRMCEKICKGSVIQIMFVCNSINKQYRCISFQQHRKKSGYSGSGGLDQHFSAYSFVFSCIHVWWHVTGCIHAVWNNCDKLDHWSCTKHATSALTGLYHCSQSHRYTCHSTLSNITILKHLLHSVHLCLSTSPQSVWHA